MIYTVTFSPSLDYTISVKDFSVGSLNRTEKERVAPGGKGLNVSSVLNNFGIRSTALGFVGGDIGECIEKMTERLGLNTDFIHCAGNSRINVKMRSNATETEINGQGADASQEDIVLLKSKLSNISENDYLVLAGSVPKNIPRSIYADIMSMPCVRGANVIVDTSGELMTNILPFKPFLIKPNDAELGEIFGTIIDSEQKMRDCAKDLWRRGARNVLVSLGGKGAYMLTNEGEEYFTEAPKGEVVDTIGSGDSVVAGFIAEWLESHDYERAFLRGVATGSASAFTYGLCSKVQSDEQFEKLLEKGVKKL